MKILGGHRTLSSGSSLVGKPSKATLSTEPVEAVRGDKYAQELRVDHVDRVKVDVDGAEEFAVDGLGDLLDGLPDLIVEVSSPDSLDGLRRRLGPDYAVVILDEGRERISKSFKLTLVCRTEFSADMTTLSAPEYSILSSATE